MWDKNRILDMTFVQYCCVWDCGTKITIKLPAGTENFMLYKRDGPGGHCLHVAPTVELCNCPPSVCCVTAFHHYMGTTEHGHAS